MLIEVKGINCFNKGSELMLRAVLQEVGGHIPEASFAVAPSRQDPYVKRASLGLYQKIWLYRYGVQWGRLAWLMPRSLRQYLGVVTDEEIDVVLDASGFVYSEQWGRTPCLTMASYVRTWKKRGVKVILLPQAMGPFESRAIRRAFASIVEGADLVFPRDGISYKHVVELTGERANVLQAPDFTVTVDGRMPEDPEKFRGRFCLVPNYRMVDKTSSHVGGVYPSFCAQCVRGLVRLGQRPFLLIHEGEKDAWLARRIVEESGERIEIVREDDVLKVKGILGLCSGVISSRYHALVSALSQGVPSLATGWSHKYETLLMEYGLPDGCLDPSLGPDVLSVQLRRLTDPDSLAEITARIRKASTLQREQTQRMWEKVFAVLTGSYPSTAGQATDAAGPSPHPNPKHHSQVVCSSHL